MYHRYVEQDLLPSEWNAWIATCEAPDVSTSSSSFSLYCVILLKMCLWVPKYWKCAWEQCSQFPHFQEVWWCRSSCTVYTNLSMAMAMLQMSCTHFLLLASSCCTNVMATYTALRSRHENSRRYGRHAWGTPQEKYIENKNPLCLTVRRLRNREALFSCL